MVDNAFDLLESTDSKQYGELEALRLQGVKALERPCFFSRIPVEIQNEVFTLAIDKSNARILALTLVCQNWRDIIITTPNLWRHLVLSPRTTIKQVDTWLQRSRGLLSSLRLLEGFSLEAKPNIFRNASADVWSRLDALEILDEHNSFSQILPTGVFEQLRLRSLELYISHSSSEFQILLDMDTSHTRTLVLNVVDGFRGNPLTFRNLTTLILRNGLIRNDLFALFEINPLLETVVLEASPPLFGPYATQPIELAHLKLFELRRCVWEHQFLKRIIFPNLENLKLESLESNGIGSIDWQCFDVLANRTLSQLQSFSLCGYSYSSASLILFLRASSALKVLTLSRCEPIQDDDDSLIVALTGADVTTQDPLQEACCPLLQHLDLSYSPRLKSGPIVSLVKARLASDVVRLDSESSSSSLKSESRVFPLPILSLNIDECPMINPDALPWLRERVSHLSARPVPVKE